MLPSGLAWISNHKCTLYKGNPSLDERFSGNVSLGENPESRSANDVFCEGSDPACQGHVSSLSGLLAQSRTQVLLYPSGRGFGVWLQSPMQAQEPDRKGSILTTAHPCFVTSSKPCDLFVPPAWGDGSHPIRVRIKGVIKKNYL